MGELRKQCEIQVKFTPIQRAVWGRNGQQWQ